MLFLSACATSEVSNAAPEGAVSQESNSLSPDLKKINVNQCDSSNNNTTKRLEDCKKVAEFSPATRDKKVPCPDGYFSDISTGYCWSCPSGYHRAWLHGIETSSACEKPAYTAYKSATNHGSPGYLGCIGQCDSGQFCDVGTEDCWSCPSGYKQSANILGTDRACYKDVPVEYDVATKGVANTCENREGGQFSTLFDSYCWNCPGPDWKRTGSSLTSSMACKNKDPKCYPTVTKGIPNPTPINPFLNDLYGWHCGWLFGSGSENLDAVDCACSHHDNHSFHGSGDTIYKFDGCNNDCALKTLLEGMPDLPWERGKKARTAILNNAAINVRWATCGC